MNVKKMILAVVVVFVLLELTNYLVHGVILASAYMQEDISKVFRAMEEMNTKMWVMYVIDIVYSFFFVFIFIRGYENKGIMEGIRYGIYIGFFMNFVGSYSQFVVYPLPYSLTFQWFVYGFIQSIIFGITASLIYKTAPAPSAE